MTAEMNRRRAPGEGHVFEYVTRAGTRFGIKFDAPGVDGRRRQVLRRRDSEGRPWLTKKAALKGLRDALADASRGNWVQPSRQPLREYLPLWLNGLRVAQSTVAGYRRHVDLHIIPALGDVQLASLTPARIDAFYRELEKSGRVDYRAGEPLSAHTVHHIHVTLSAALKAAVEGGQLALNPASRAHPPSAREAAPPEMHPWTAEQLATFLEWSLDNSFIHTAWRVLAMTGMRRGEVLALRWRDVDLDAARITVRRSVTLVKTKGAKERLVEGPPKNGKPRVIDLDAGTVAALRAHRLARAALTLPLGRDDARVIGDEEDRVRNPDRFTRLFTRTLTRCRRDLGEDTLPMIRLHDLRHTHATLLLSRGEDVKLVSARLGHASPTVTLTTYAHVLPGRQAAAVRRLAESLGQGASS